MNPIPYAYFAIFFTSLEMYQWAVQQRKLTVDDLVDKEEINNILAMVVRVEYLINQLTSDTQLRTQILQALGETITPEVEKLVEDVIENYWKVRNGDPI